MVLLAFLSLSCFKLLFIPSYKSTDFEVHRNWLAITNSLPTKQWYYNEESEWTLDYPPLFAWFEYVLSLFAGLFDKNMLSIQNHNYSSFETVLFQRLTVIITDFVYILGTYRCCKALPIKLLHYSDIIIPILLLSNIGLFIVDHLHFQYNGIMFGVLLISIAHILKYNYLQGAFYFAILLNMKHIFLYIAPVYFIYLLRNFCLQTKASKTTFSIKNFTCLGMIVSTVFLVSFLPFYSHIGQIFTRLFPFKRGLCHAYWAPNFWAFYNSLDLGLTIIGKLCGFEITKPNDSSMTGGLVQDIVHTVLPTIRPLATITLTILFSLPALYKLWKLPQKPLDFIRCLVLCGLTSYMFGWHVHEKAILIAIIPLGLVSIFSNIDAKIFILLSTVGHFSLHPLLFAPNLILIKLCLILFSFFIAICLLKDVFEKRAIFSKLEMLFVSGLVPLFLYTEFIHRFTPFANMLPFLPLLMTSLYCSVGIIYCYVRYYIYFMSTREINNTEGKCK